jgi:hypothetical protein
MDEVLSKIAVTNRQIEKYSSIAYFIAYKFVVCSLSLSLFYLHLLTISKKKVDETSSTSGDHLKLRDLIEMNLNFQAQLTEGTRETKINTYITALKAIELIILITIDNRVFRVTPADWFVVYTIHVLARPLADSREAIRSKASSICCMTETLVLLGVYDYEMTQWTREMMVIVSMYCALYMHDYQGDCSRYFQDVERASEFSYERPTMDMKNCMIRLTALVYMIDQTHDGRWLVYKTHSHMLLLLKQYLKTSPWAVDRTKNIRIPEYYLQSTKRIRIPEYYLQSTKRIRIS